MLAEAPKQWERFQLNKAKRVKGLPKWKRELEDIDGKVADAKAHAEELRRQYDPELTRINANFNRKHVVSGGLKCPVCGEENHGNVMNGKPWCMKDNVALESPFQVKKRLPNMKILPKTRKLEATFRGLDE